MQSHDDKIEQMIQEKGATAPRLTPADIDAKIADVTYYRHGDTTLTICVLTLQNGFTIVAESAAASADNFDPEIGRQIAFENARKKIWPLEGYLLRQKLHEGVA